MASVHVTGTHRGPGSDVGRLAALPDHPDGRSWAALGGAASLPLAAPAIVLGSGRDLVEWGHLVAAGGPRVPACGHTHLADVLTGAERLGAPPTGDLAGPRPGR